MSALPPKADMCNALAHVCFVPIAGSCTATKELLFDNFVGPGEQRRRHSEAKRIRSLEINHQFVLGRCLHRHVSGLLTLEDAIDVACRLSELVNYIDTVGDQAAGGYRRSIQYTAGSFTGPPA